MIEESCFKYMREIHREILSRSEGPSGAQDVHLCKELRETLKMLKSVENQESIIFIGSDKSGKSTLINYLLGNPLVVTGSTNRQVISVTKGNESLGPAINMKTYQQVRRPTVWQNNKAPGKKVLVEFPGHGKFSSVDQEKFNHLVAPVLYCSVKQVWLVLVWNATDILTGKFREPLEQVKFLDNLFDKQLAALMPCISIVFTHVPDVFCKHAVNVDYLIRSINQYVNSTQLVPPAVKTFLQEMGSQPLRHGVFKKPMAAGPLNSRLDVNIRQSLLNVGGISFDELAYLLFAAIPLSTSIFSQELADTIGAEIFVKLEKVATQITRTSSSVDARTQEELKAQKQRLMNYRQLVREGLKPDVSIRAKIEILEALDPSLETIVQEGQLHRKLEIAKMVKNSIRLAMRRLSVIDKAMNYLLMKVCTDSELMIQNVNLQLRILQEVSAVRDLKSENEKLEKEAIKLMNKINFIRRNEQKRKSLAARFFRRDRVATALVNVVSYCTEPLLRRFLRMSGLQYVASGFRSSLLAFTDVTEGDR